MNLLNKIYINKFNFLDNILINFKKIQNNCIFKKTDINEL